MGPNDVQELVDLDLLVGSAQVGRFEPVKVSGDAEIAPKPRISCSHADDRLDKQRLGANAFYLTALCV